MAETRHRGSNPQEPLEPKLMMTHLTWLEHGLFGSTAPDREGKIITLATALARGPEFYLQPVGLSRTPPVNIGKIALERNGKTLDKIEIFERQLKGYTSRLFLPGLYPNGQVQGIFQFQLISQDTDLAISSREMQQLLQQRRPEIIEELRGKLLLEFVPFLLFRNPDDLTNVGYLKLTVNGYQPPDPYIKAA